MSKLAPKILCFLSILQNTGSDGISMVYNFRIAQINKQPFGQPEDKKNRVVGLVFDQYRKKRTGTRQNYGGGLGSYIRDFKTHYYVRTDFAVSHIEEKTCGVTTFSGTETDDILFTLGRNFSIDTHQSITLSGLFGIPTHRIHRLQHADFGYGQIGTGVQLDGLYEFNDITALIYGTRYIYFVPREAHDPFGLNHRFTIGNVTDILLAFKNNWNNHGLEFGYTARFRFGAHSFPGFDDIIEKTNYARSNIYAVYKYRFSINNIPNRFLFNISYGTDHIPKLLGNKYIITLWASWNVNF